MEAKDIKQQLIDHLSNPRVIIHEFTVDASASDGVKLSFSVVTIDLDADKSRSEDNFIRVVKEAILR